MTKPQVIAILKKYCTVPNQNKTKYFISETDIPKIATEIAGISKGSFIPPTLNEVKEFFKSKGYSETGAIKAWEHYDYGNWIDSKGTPVRNWKQKMNTNWLRDEYKIVDNSKENGNTQMVF